MDTENFVISQTPETASPNNPLPPIINYADDPETRSHFQNEVAPVLLQTRANRQVLEDEWTSIRNMRYLVHDTGQKYKGRSNAYLPTWVANERTMVAGLNAGLFPSDDYMGVTAMAPGDAGQQMGDAVKKYMRWELEVQARVKTSTRAFLRQLVAYGSSVMRNEWRQMPKEAPRLGSPKGRVRLSPKAIANAAFPSSTLPTYTPMTKIPGMRVSPRSIYYFYVWPETAESLDDALGCFEDIDVPRKVVEEMGRRGWLINVDRVLNSTSTATRHFTNQSYLRAIAGVQLQTQVNPESKTLVASEIWTFMKLPASAYRDEEDKAEPLPARIIAFGSEPALITRNPYWHQRPPYHFATMNAEPGLLYGFGFGKQVLGLQRLTNDFANQTNDAGIYSLNPVIKYNPALMAGPMQSLAPGRAYPMSDPKAMEFDRPDIGIISGGLQLLQFYTAVAQDTGGAPPILQGLRTSVGKAGATGAQILQRNAMTPLGDIVEEIEEKIMLPMVEAGFSNAQQFRTDEVMIAVGGQPMRVGPDMLAVDAMFEWLASSQAANKFQRASQALQLLQAVTPMIPNLLQAGYQVNPEILIRRIYDDSLGLPDVDSFITKVNPAAPTLPSADAIGQTQDRIRSATEAVTGQMGAEDMAPGEGEDFMQMRNLADDVAGGANGQ